MDGHWTFNIMVDLTYIHSCIPINWITRLWKISQKLQHQYNNIMFFSLPHFYIIYIRLETRAMK